MREEVGCEASRVDHVELELVDFLVDSRDKLKHEVDEFFLFVDEQVLSRDQEREVVAWVRRLLAENLEAIGTERHKPIEHPCEQVFDLHALLDHDGDANGVDTAFDHAHLLITLANENGLHE